MLNPHVWFLKSHLWPFRWLKNFAFSSFSLVDKVMKPVDVPHCFWPIWVSSCFLFIILDYVWSNPLKSLVLIHYFWVTYGQIMSNPLKSPFVQVFFPPCWNVPKRAPGDHHDGSFWMGFLGQDGHKRLDLDSHLSS